MPPVRTTRSRGGKNAGTLSAFGFVPVTGEEAITTKVERPRVVKSPPELDSGVSPASTGNFATDVSNTARELIKAEDSTPTKIKVEDPTPAKIKVEDPTPAKIKVEDPTPIRPAPINAFQRLKVANRKGISHAMFRTKDDWEEHSDASLGSTTKSITFQTGFSLKPEHFDFILSRPALCKKLLHFEFCYDSVPDEPEYNRARDVTDECIIRLAEACPKLKIFKLPGYYSGDLARCVESLGENCPNLTLIDLSDLRITDDSVFDVLHFNPDLLPALKTLRLGEMNTRHKTMKTMRAMSKERSRLLIQFVMKREVKKYYGGPWCKDWVLEVHSNDYKKGRRYEPRFREADIWEMYW